ncbi:HlyU family transcriptional regulator [Roseivivax isoporae]|uniref:Transcriptional activator HlyU n=1 Tax=Roseivivax isoporae LMG 25204 TaxID=1449351 RepID=X7F372_9RHOB|nr:HlyU family transcriptional regulator [Roseivivax isoporae]ETX27372.1 hypothetical protein RISW2_14345 [Roseivivax isoporae LMG 25204]
MSLFGRLFGKGGGASHAAATEAEPVDHKGYAIHPDPMPEGSRWRIAARIERVVDGEAKVHRLIRADTLDDRDQAVEASVRKARQMIDEQGDGIFG